MGGGERAKKIDAIENEVLMYFLTWKLSESSDSSSSSNNSFVLHRSQIRPMLKRNGKKKKKKQKLQLRPSVRLVLHPALLRRSQRSEGGFELTAGQL